MIKKGVRKDAFFVAVPLPAATQGDNLWMTMLLIYHTYPEKRL
jgi:hypothetical protein